MFHLRSPFGGIFLALIFLASVLSYASAETQKPFYVSPESLPPTLLLPPPSEKSTAWQEEIRSVLAAQKNTSNEDRIAMRAEQKMRIELLTPILGNDFTRERKPKTFVLLDHVLSDTAAISEADKRFWHTRRPYLTDHRIKLWIDPLNESPGYPSGHTSETRVLAEVLGQLYPEQRAALREAAANIAWRRVEAGVHAPVDLEGGRALAMLILGSLMLSDDFQDDFLAAQKEASAQK